MTGFSIQAPDNTQNLNRYTYCLNNPLRYVDPTGESVWTTTDPEEIRALYDFIREKGYNLKSATESFSS